MGPSGFVVGVDLADRLLENARAKAKRRGLLNVQFRLGDLLDLRIADAIRRGCLRATSAFWGPIQKERADLYKGFNPRDRICDPLSLSALFAEAGIANLAVAAESGRHSISSPEAWWAAVLGSGYRGTVEQLDAPPRERVRVANFEFIRNSGCAPQILNQAIADASKYS